MQTRDAVRLANDDGWWPTPYFDDSGRSLWTSTGGCELLTLAQIVVKAAQEQPDAA